VMANVWVVGDLIDIARASRMCFIALGRLGRLEQGVEPRMDAAVDHLALEDIKSPLHAMLQSGVCPDFASTVNEIAARPVVYLPRKPKPRH
jgi:hypothetical protein